MTRRPSGWLGGLVGACLFIGALLPPAAIAQDFSADTVTHLSGRVIRGKLYRKSDMVRAESATPGPGAARSMFTIVDLKNQVSYTISNQERLIMVAHGRGALSKIGIAYPAGVNPCTPASGPPSRDVSCKQLGEEIVNGRNTVKWQLTETLNGQTATQYVWFDPKLRAAIKVQMGPATIELQNIQAGPQPASLFAIPTGYREMNVGGR